MPVGLVENSVRFPTGFAPWYVYKATLVGSPNAFVYGDILLPDAAGAFNLDIAATHTLSLDTGYAFALEPFTTGMTEVQVAVPGSVFPAIAMTDIRPEQLVKVSSNLGAQIMEAALDVDITGGVILGRFRNHHFNNEILRETADFEIINVLTGVI